MNFPAHAWVTASLPGASAEQVLGSMLPDLLPMVGVREVDVPLQVEHGRRLHHRCDETFHAHPVFLEAVAALRGDLEMGGVARGPRRAAAHAGYELLLDDVVPWDERTVGRYLDALRSGAALSAHPQWRTLLARLATDPRDWPPSGPALAAARVERILARRPRLALAAGDRDVLATALGAAEPALHDAAADLLGAVVSRLVA